MALINGCSFWCTGRWAYNGGGGGVVFVSGSLRYTLVSAVSKAAQAKNFGFFFFHSSIALTVFRRDFFYPECFAFVLVPVLSA